MWSSVVVLALLGALNPVRLGLALLVISRPRPVKNLLAFWVGCLIASIAILLVPLVALHVAPMFRPLAQNLASPATVASSTVRHIQIGMGLFALSIAVLTTVRFLARRRAHLPTKGGNTTTMVLDSNAPIAIKRLLGGPQDESAEGKSAIRRLPGRARNAWANGSSWVALMIGLGSGPTPDGVLYVLAIIVPSGAAIGTQISAAIAFVVGMLAIVEIMLVCYLATPAKTHAAVQRLHDWVLAHRQQVLVAVCTVAGISLVAQGMRSG
jgi:hypothetical protein